MKVESFSFRGKWARPTPYLLIDENIGYAIVVTPWGPKSTAEGPAEAAIEFIKSSLDNSEVTSPFGLNTSLSQYENIAKNAILTASNFAYRNINKDEFVSGFEILILMRHRQELIAAIVGHTSIFLRNPSGLLSCLVSTHNSENIPQDLVGLERNANVLVRSWRADEGSDLLILNSTQCSINSLSKLVDRPDDVPNLFKTLISTKLIDSFWLGKISL